MITFFRKIRKRLLSENSVSRYLIYAIGEIALVMIGILLALQVNNWNQGRKEKAIEQELLLQFQTDLNGDLEALNKIEINYELIIQSCEIIVDHLKNKKPWQDSLALHFDLWNDYEAYFTNTGAISNLNSRGVELIRNTPLRNKILNLYNQVYPSSKKGSDFFREDHVHITYKIHLERIEPVQWLEKAIPNNYEALYEDQIFINHVQWIRNAASFNSNKFKEVKEEIKILLSLLQTEIN